MNVQTPEEISTISFIGEQMGSAIAKSLLEEENARLTEEKAEMKRQLETRKAVERAKGILQKRHGLSEEESYLRMRNESRRLRRPMKDLADAIILSEELLARKARRPRTKLNSSAGLQKLTHKSKRRGGQHHPRR